MGMGPPPRPITAVLLCRTTIRMSPPPRLPSATTPVSPSNGPPKSSPFWRSCSANKRIEVALRQVGFTNETIMHKRQDSGVPVYPNGYASERNIVRYAKIAMELKEKTVRDVALRCRWMNKKENGKRRKEDHSSTRKNKDKKEKVADPMAKSAPHATNRSNGPPYAQPVISMDSDDGISYKAIGGVAGELLEQNAHALDQISANFAAFKMHENINLFCQARNNILTILNDMNDMPDIMKQMPPLPVKLNEELANSILPRSSLQKNSLS